ncbi:hypothetical protein G7Y89_g15069 [Cudoniella acicularis]|uniref:2EXR domain-containing protein n=1 Tax=Cudoniella acicularis TaxID=354080 RepID=A0A8H4QUT2_9HELO|nr:hypothetical protein G7Y89_g15069 [Cudoniella acicularis]
MCGAHFWGHDCVKHHVCVRSDSEPQSDGAFSNFSKLPPELQAMIWAATLPSYRLVYIDDKFTTRNDFRRLGDMTMDWEDENGNVISLEIGFDNSSFKQRQLERFGFTSSQRTPQLDNRRIVTGRGLLDCPMIAADDCWLYSPCQSDVETLAKTNRAARSAVKRRYELSFGNRYGPARIWFDFDTDYLFLGCKQYYYGLQSRAGPTLDLSLFNEKYLARVKNLAMQYPDLENNFLEETMRYFGKLNHLVLVLADSSEDNRGDLEFAPIEHSTIGIRYTNPRWTNARLRKFIGDLRRLGDKPGEWFEGVIRDLHDLEKESIKNGQPFTVPEVEAASVVSQKTYQTLTYWTKIFRRLERLKVLIAEHPKLQQPSVEEAQDTGETYESLVSKLQVDQDAVDTLEKIIEVEDFEEELANQARLDKELRHAEEMEKLAFYERQIESDEQEAYCDWVHSKSFGKLRRKGEKKFTYSYFLISTENNAEENDDEYCACLWENEEKYILRCRGQDPERHWADPIQSAGLAEEERLKLWMMGYEAEKYPDWFMHYMVDKAGI